MTVNQLSIFVENKKGRLCEVTECLSKAKIDIRALSLADTTDYGILRLVVNDPSKAIAELKTEGFTATVTSVIAIKLPDHCGGLHEVLKTLEENNTCVEYAYAFLSCKEKSACVILRVDDNESAAKALIDNGHCMLSFEDVKLL